MYICEFFLDSNISRISGLKDVTRSQPLKEERSGCSILRGFLRVGEFEPLTTYPMSSMIRAFGDAPSSHSVPTGRLDSVSSFGATTLIRPLYLVTKLSQ